MTGLLDPDRDDAEAGGDSTRADGDHNAVAGSHAHHNALGTGSSVRHNEYSLFSFASAPKSRRDLVVPFLFFASLVLSACLVAMFFLKGSGRTVFVVVCGAVLLSGVAAMAWRRHNGEGGEQAMMHADREAAARRGLLDTTERLWVRDALEESLASAVRLEVGLGEQLGVVKDPFGAAALALVDGAELPAGTRLRELTADEIGARLLVLGSPGAGKTTHLLELAADQVNAARRDPRVPVPLVLLMSTWVDGPGGLAGWVAAEARQRYLIGTAHTLAWLASGSIMLLLDGLDEVDESLRDRCLEVIEEFCTDPAYRDTGLALTSRTQEFDELRQRLSVSRAVRVLPLDGDQISRTLANGGPELTALRQAVAEVPAVRDLLTTPLMLDIAVLAFARLEPGTHLPTGDYRQTLFGLYVHQMLYRVRALRSSADGSAVTASLEPADIYHHLVWLARLMSRQGQTIFYPDLMTPAWLPDRRSPWSVSKRRGPLGWIARKVGWDHTSTGLVGGRLAAVAGALSAAPLGALVHGTRGAVTAALGGSLLLGCGVALTFGVLFVFRSSAVEKFARPVVGHDTYNLYAATSWTWSGTSALRGLVTWAIFGAVVSGGLFLAGASAGAALAVAAVLGCGGVLAGGSTPDHEKPPTVRGGALAASLQRLNRLLLALVVLVLVATIATLLLGGPWKALLAAFPTTVAFMVTAGPGRAWLRHRAAYFGAEASGLFPADLTRLLGAAEDRVLLRRVGGGYMFLHRDLQEYLERCRPDRPADSLLGPA
ncbi:NACHT domain-containing protein [Streptomyces aureus]|uniref:NACHT domain-containing protein n=1 Tax=Streptomyces aureus TaxID=193461 RepID=UPI0036A2A61C